MIAPSSLSRAVRPAALVKPSSSFLSAKALPLRTRRASLERRSAGGGQPARPARSLSLLSFVSHARAQSLSASPFLPSKFRAGHENAFVEPGKIVWKPPIYNARARSLLAKQAFQWRIFRHILNLPHPSLSATTTTTTTSSGSSNLIIPPRRLKKLIQFGSDHRHNPNRFYDGTLSVHDYTQIPQDPVPILVELFGGMSRLSLRDKRYMGLIKPIELKDVMRSIKSPSSSTEINHSQSSQIPRYDQIKIIPNRLGHYSGKNKIFKGKIRERNRQAKTEQVSSKMLGMKDRIESFRKEFKLIKERSKPLLPF